MKSFKEYLELKEHDPWNYPNIDHDTYHDWLNSLSWWDRLFGVPGPEYMPKGWRKPVPVPPTPSKPADPMNPTDPSNPMRRETY